MRVLIAEDEKNLNALIKKVLEKEGMSVDNAFDGKEALLFLESESYDIAVLDIMMPGCDGIEVVKTMRGRKDSTPVLFLTARDAVSDKVKGLDSGADDYLVKPFDFQELLARIRAITRKYHVDRSPVLRVGDLELDTATKEVRRQGVLIRLSSKEFSLLEFMMRHPGKILSRDQIESNMYDFDYDGASNVIDVYISYLRKKIDADFDTKLIHTMRGSGWCIKEK